MSTNKTKEEDFVIYQRFLNKQEAEMLFELLARNDIEFTTEDTTPAFDPTFANTELNNEFRIKLRKEDFEKADKIQEHLLLKQVEVIDGDYYLYAYSNQELVAVLQKQDEWSKFDGLVAQKILKDRGQEVSEAQLSLFQKQRMELLAGPEEGQGLWILVGYMLAMLGGIFGVFIGWQLVTHKKTLPNGERVYGYSYKDRKHGISMIVVGISFFLLELMLLISFR